MSIKKAIYEHLKTKKKYNTLQLKYEILQEEHEKLLLRYNEYKKLNKVQKEIWETKLKEQEEEIIKLKRRRRKNEKNSTNNS